MKATTTTSAATATATTTAKTKKRSSRKAAKSGGNNRRRSRTAAPTAGRGNRIEAQQTPCVQTLAQQRLLRLPSRSDARRKHRLQLPHPTIGHALHADEKRELGAQSPSSTSTNSNSLPPPRVDPLGFSSPLISNSQFQIPDNMLKFKVLTDKGSRLIEAESVNDAFRKAL